MILSAAKCFALAMAAVVACCPPAAALTAREIRARLEAEGDRRLRANPMFAGNLKFPVNWAGDGILAGDPDTEIRGIAVSWLATEALLKEALKRGANLFIVHEPPYGTQIAAQPLPGEEDAAARKAAWLKKTGMVLYRCHNVEDLIPGFGVRSSWPKWLGFKGKPLAGNMIYEVYDTGGLTLDELSRRIAARVRPLGQRTVGVVGDPARKTRRIITGTGVGTRWRDMALMGADVLVVTDDGNQSWEAGQWALDANKSLIIVNHGTAEEPGIKALSDYVAKLVKVPVIYLPVGCIYRTVGAR